MAAAEDLNWSIEVEDLVDNGDTKGAISLLESVIDKLETLNSSSSSSSSSMNLKLATALTDLANLYSSQGFSLKSDEFQSHSVSSTVSASGFGSPAPPSEDDDGADDWESIADRPVDEILTPPPVHDIGISKLSVEEEGAFMYKKNSLYSDQQTDSVNNECSDDDEVEVGQSNSDEKLKSGICNFWSTCYLLYDKFISLVFQQIFGTSHVLVLADFPPSTRTMELEKLFESFKRSAGLSFAGSMILLLLQYLEPPTPRPKTSVRTAQRLIAQLRKQEEARKSRIVTRQNLKDEAWAMIKRKAFLIHYEEENVFSQLYQEEEETEH
ncbi:hypothetical protein MKW92_031068 [Papaver armeniacum]|nr:hypothetical protein MKW92_031068 [Papaver armeniacum]